MANREFYDLIIIGGGAAGLSAGIYALRASMRTVLIEHTTAGGQITKSDMIENYPGFVNINGFDLSEKFLEHARNYNLEILTEAVVTVQPGLDHHLVELAGGERLKAHAVIMATGGMPRKLNVPGEDEYYGKGVSYCAVCDGYFFRGKSVTVIGGGDTAAEEALYLSKLTRKVTLIHRRDALRASMILQERLKCENNIEIIWNNVIDAIKGDNDRLQAVELTNTLTRQKRSLQTEGVFIFIGFKPNNHLVPAGIKLSTEGYVCTDHKCETNIPGIFAAGDLREKYARQIVVSAADGCNAALASAHYVEMKRSQS